MRVLARIPEATADPLEHRLHYPRWPFRISGPHGSGSSADPQNDKQIETGWLQG